MKVNSWKNKQVLLTGHTGFKGAWLSLWLCDQGAKVHGIALDPPTQTNFFTEAKINSLLSSDTRIDIRDHGEVSKIMHSVKPEVVFHMAAQPLVKYSYDFPIETYAVNVMGTAHVLDAIRTCESVRAAVVITSDKCYENREWIYPYREEDPLGGRDPYSNSKACSELVTTAFRSSYFSTHPTICVATARAGNVIGGGDWAMDRLIPDCIRAYLSKNAITLRYPEAIRPWQHVLESIDGYQLLAEHLLREDGSRFSRAWNFGPDSDDMRSVGEVANMICHPLNVPVKMPTQMPKRHEATFLQLDSTKAKEQLKWHPRWRLKQSIEETVEWYRHWMEGDDMLNFSRLQIERYYE